MLRFALILVALTISTYAVAQPSHSADPFCIRDAMIHSDCFTVDSAASQPVVIENAFVTTQSIYRMGDKVTMKVNMKASQDPILLKSDGDCAAKIVHGALQKTAEGWVHRWSVKQHIQFDCGLGFLTIGEQLTIDLLPILGPGTYRLEFQDRSYRILETNEFEVVE